MASPPTSSALLAIIAAALIAYASLYPLTGWDHPAGWAAWREVQLPWPRRSTTFDTVSNVLGYVPLGALALIAFVRGSGWPVVAAFAGAILVGAGLSLSMEVLQNFLPRRVPSALDWVCNLAGTVAGAMLAAGLQTAGFIDRWLARHDRWFLAGSAGGTTLLLLWPLALLFPTPVPLALGHVFDHFADWGLNLVSGTPLEAPLLAWIGLSAPDVMAAASMRPPLPPPLETGIVAVSLLAPCLVAFSISAPGWRRAVLCGGAAVLALAVLTLSTALNFGPQHAGAWRTPQALQGMAIGCVVGCLLAWIPWRLAALLGLGVLIAMVVLTAQAPADPYFAVSLAAWEQGRFVRFHGAAQWIGWIWPFAAMVYLATRLAKERR
jgi:VanZ family protein